MTAIAGEANATIVSGSGPIVVGDTFSLTGGADIFGSFTLSAMSGMNGDDLFLQATMGAMIDSSLTLFDSKAHLAFHSFVDDSHWSIGEDAYVGFRFDLDGIGSDWLFGWLRIEFTNTQNFTISQWAYEDVTGAAIVVGDLGGTPIPEPNSALLVGIGLAGLSFLSRSLGKESRRRDRD